MATKSDFAQKLLHDLRLRKERMAAAENSSRQSSHTSRVTRGNLERASKGARQINALESAGSTTGNTSRRSNGGSRSINIKESSNQIVLYESGQSSRQVRDLSMAIAFAFENSGNLSKIGASSRNPLVNFFSRFGRRSLGGQKMDMTNFNTHGFSIDQLPNVSHIHISEISKGVQKLNQILRACSNGINFDRNSIEVGNVSIEVGKELLKGAVNLEESLRTLVNLQEASKYVTGAQSRSRIKLLDEEEDDQDNDNTADQWKLDLPRFSFDKHTRNSYVVQGPSRRQQSVLSYSDETSEELTNNSRMVSHERSSSYIPDMSLSTQLKLNKKSNSSEPMQEKGRISNVIAKLMGLEEPPLKEDSTSRKNDSKGKQGKVSRRNTKLTEDLNRENRNGSTLSTDKNSTPTNNTPIRESKLQLKAEKSSDIPDGNSKIVWSERNKLQKDMKMPAVSMGAVPGQKLANSIMNRKQSHHTAPNLGNGLQSFEDSEKRQNLTEDKESNAIENESKMLGLNTQLQRKAQKSKTLKAEEKTHNRFEYKVSPNSMEKRHVYKDIPGNQQKSQDQNVLRQHHVPKRNEHSEDNRRAEQKGQQFHKQGLVTKKWEGHQVETMIASKSKKGIATNLQKKLSRDKPAPGNEKSIKHTEKVSTRDPPNRRHQDAAPMIDLSQKTESNQETLKKEDQSHDSSPREPQVDIKKEIGNLELTKEKSVEVPATDRNAIPRNVQRSEIPQKIDVLITRRNATLNHLERPRKQPAKILKDLKQQIQNKNRSPKRNEEQSDGELKEAKASISIHDASDMTTEPVNQQEMLQNEAHQTIILDSYVADECQVQTTPIRDGKIETPDLHSGNDSAILQKLEQPYDLKDEQGLKECDQIGDHEEITELNKLSQQEYKQYPACGRQEQLTEPEKDLKEILIKSQLFLSTAEALFKLNIPVSFLHAGDHEDEVTKKKLILDTAYEVMKRKARRHEVPFHPYTKSTMSNIKVKSLDDLVKQLCKDLEMLKFYGGNMGDDVAASLCTMLNKDIYNKDPDINSMWDFEWSKMGSMIPEKDVVIRGVERHMLNELLDEITNDLLLVSVSV